MLDRFDFEKEEIPQYEMFDPFSGMFFVVNFMLRENLAQDYTPTKIKHIVENTLFLKSSYIYVPVILTHKRNFVKVGTKTLSSNKLLHQQEI